MKPRHSLKSLRQDARGATAIEFSIVAGVFFMMVLGIMEYGLIQYSKVVIETITNQAAREVSIGKKAGCVDRVSCIKNLIKQKADAANLMQRQSVVIGSRVVSNPNTDAPPPTPDMCLDEGRPPYAPTCKQYYDSNDNGIYEPAGDIGEADIGKADELVEIRVTYFWHVIFPIFRSRIGHDGVLPITTTTVLKNEPFSEDNK